LDYRFLAVSSYAQQREVELDILTKVSIKNALHEQDIELINFTGL